VAPESGRTYGGEVFASKAEMIRYMELLAMEGRGEIGELRRQPSFEIIAAGRRNRARRYTADFSYKEGGSIVIEEVKGVFTAEYKLRRDLFLQRYPELRFRETRDGVAKEF
jgi:hypothetical protein